MSKQAITFVDDETIRFDTGPERLTLKLEDAVERAKPMHGVVDPTPDDYIVQSNARVELMLWALTGALNRFTDDVVGKMEERFAATANLNPETILGMLMENMPEIMKMMGQENGKDRTGQTIRPGDPSKQVTG